MKTTTPRKESWDFKILKESIEGFEDRYREDIDEKMFFGFPIEAILKAESQLHDARMNSVAYFSMEYGLAPSIYNSFRLSQPMSEENQFFAHDVFSNYWLCDYLFKIHTDKMLDIPIYGGGLGVLAGDVIKSAADLKCSFVGIGILWNKGYFKQNFWYKHGQVPEELMWDPHTYPGLVPLKNIISIDTMEGALHLRLWKYYVYSNDKRDACPLILLDSNLEQNPEHFRQLTDQLYRSDDVWWKIFQRVILGIGGMKALNDMGYHIDLYHLNEGHAAFALLEEYRNSANKEKFKQSRSNFVFTCHTPVAAGHDRFHVDNVSRIMTRDYVEPAKFLGIEKTEPNMINLTFMSLNNCSRVNAVAQKHGEIMRLQFPDYGHKIDAITNGVHTHTWTTESFVALLDKYVSVLGDWKAHPENLERIELVRGDQDFRKNIFEAHLDNKKNLMEMLKQWQLNKSYFTLGWARRIAGYKRPGLIFHCMDRIIELAKEIGPIQFIMAGKAHPNDDIGGAHIDKILDHIDQLNPYRQYVKVLILENYDTYFGKLLTSSVDVWLNNPLPPFEASGTSGMKAIMNGVLQLSTLDGWVVEAASDDIGWIFGYQHEGEQIGRESDLKMEEDSRALFDTLKDAVTLYYKTFKDGKVDYQSVWIDKMINCVRRSAFFNTQRMVQEYYDKMWFQK